MITGTFLPNFVGKFDMGVREDITDHELLASFAKGDVKAYEALFERYWKGLYEQAYKRLRNDTFAEDIVQDVFLDIWERRQTLRIEGSVRSYLGVAVRNRIINWLGRTNLHQASMHYLVGRMEQFATSVHEELLAKDLQATLDDAVANLPDTAQHIFILRSEQFSIREIAEALGLAEQTVKNKSSETLTFLKQSLLKKHPDLNRSFVVALAAIILS